MAPPRDGLEEVVTVEPTWRELVCARCGGTVAAARCPTCLAARRDFLDREPTFPTPAQWAAFLAALLVALTLWALHA